MNTPHTHAAILSIGDELVLGQKLDTNSQWLSDQLISRGIGVLEHATIADNLHQNISTLRRLAGSAPLLITTGGLGPTADDLTRQALAVLLGDDLIEDAPALEHLERSLAARGRILNEQQRLQVRRPRSAAMLDNPNGTAPGLFATARLGAHACDVFCLPGPPREMHPMFEAQVVPRLRPPPGRTVRTRVLHCLGVGESDLARALGHLMDRARNPLVGTTASGGIVSIRIRYEGAEADAGRAMLETERACRDAAGPYCWGEEDQSIQAVVLDVLRRRSGTLVTAESCTGGLLGALLTGVPGSSDVYLGGWVTYANDFKAGLIGVPGDALRAHGAVSEPVARAMAEGALRASRSGTHAIAVTGIAGPGGAAPGKPVGTVFIAVATRTATDARRFSIPGDRTAVRDRAARLALAMLRFITIGAPTPRLLWQMTMDGSPLPPGP